MDSSPAARKTTVMARDGRAPVPWSMYQKEKGIGAAVVKVARPAGRILLLLRCAMIESQQNSRRAARGFSITNRLWPLLLAGVEHGHVVGVGVDGCRMSTRVGGEIK